MDSPSYRQIEERPESVADVNSFWLPLEDGVAQVHAHVTLLLSIYGMLTSMPIFSLGKYAPGIIRVSGRIS